MCWNLRWKAVCFNPPPPIPLPSHNPLPPLDHEKNANSWNLFLTGQPKGCLYTDIAHPPFPVFCWFFLLLFSDFFFFFSASLQKEKPVYTNPKQQQQQNVPSSQLPVIGSWVWVSSFRTPRSCCCPQQTVHLATTQGPVNTTEGGEKCAHCDLNWPTTRQIN